MLKDIWLNHRHRRNRKSWIWRAKHHKEDDGVVVNSIEVGFMYFLTLFRYIFKILFVTLLALAILGVLFYKYKLVPLYNKYNEETNTILANTSTDDFKINEGSIIYDTKGRVIANLYDTANNKYICYKDIPEDVVNAFIAVEDRTFWTNTGIDVHGIGRVIYRYMQSDGDEMHGASTVTQQLARNVYLTHEVSIERKLKEMLIAMKLTKIYTKEQIMEFYCNDICFANGIYGIGGAAHAYFDKDIQKCTLSEIAYLCSIPNSPEYYNPYTHPDRAIERRDKILNDMYSLGYIDKTSLDKALSQKIKIKEPDFVFNDYMTTYAVDCATKYLMKLDGFNFKYTFTDDESYTKYHENYDYCYQQAKAKLYNGGYRIRTSLDKDVYTTMQGILDDKLSFDTEIDEGTNTYALQGAMTVVDNKTHKVVAVVGGRTEPDSKKVYSLNRAYQSPRQPGSSIKPLIVYTPALQVGFTADSRVMDIDVDTALNNPDGIPLQKGNSMSLRNAVEWSKNGVACQVYNRITPEYGMSHITNMRFSHICKDDYYLSACLGGFTYGTTTAEMASAYSCLVNHGEFYENTCITSIKDSDNNEIYKDDKPVDVYTGQAADAMVDILKGVLTSGTASGYGWSYRSNTDAMGKTGTTNDNKDGWMCGSTPYYSISVWVGYDTPRSTSYLYGSTYPTSIWGDAMLSLIQDKDTAKFEKGDYATNQTPEHSAGYYSYLEGRDDDEVLSYNYTVGNYRSDRMIGEQIQQKIDEMSTCKDRASLNKVYGEAKALVSTIYGVTYNAEMDEAVESAYNSLINSLPEESSKDSSDN